MEISDRISLHFEKSRHFQLVVNLRMEEFLEIFKMAIKRDAEQYYAGIVEW